MRSTSGIIWGNTSAATLQKFTIYLDHERSSRADCIGTYGGRCDGTRSFDENSGLHGYKCLGQPGWGPPQATNMSAPSFSGFFVWANTNKASLVNATIDATTYQNEHLVAGRDFFNATNMSSGVISSRPSTCSAGTPRDIFISTDENRQGATVYICSATNTWKKHWEPYSYPHPLRGSTWVTYIIETYDHSSGWVLDTGKTYTYSMAVKQALIGKKVARALQGTTQYTAATSIASVESTAGSYYYDASAGKLYVHCTNNVNPSNYLIAAYFKE
jgi:hypothetical protein